MQQRSGGNLWLLIPIGRLPPVPVAIYPDFQILERAAIIVSRFFLVGLFVFAGSYLSVNPMRLKSPIFGWLVKVSFIPTVKMSTVRGMPGTEDTPARGDPILPLTRLQMASNSLRAQSSPLSITLLPRFNPLRNSFFCLLHYCSYVLLFFI